MQVQVRTDDHIEGRERLIEHVEGVIRDAVDRFEDHVTHVEAHLGDANGSDKSGANDMCCLIEARVAGMKSVAIRHEAFEEAFEISAHIRVGVFLDEQRG